MWQLRIKDHEGNIHQLGQPMLYHEAAYWRNRILALGEWCQLEKVRQ